MYHQIQDLAAVNEVVFIALTDENIPDVQIRHFEKICKSVHLFRLSRISIYVNLWRGLIKGWPIQVSYFFNKSIQRQINQIIASSQPDRIYAQLIRTAEYVKHVPVNKTLDYMDCFSLNSARRAETSTGLKKTFWEWEAARVKKYEAVIFPYFTSHTIISNIDSDHMPAECKPIAVVPNGIDRSFFTINPDKERDIDLLFVGNLSYYSNEAAVLYLIKNILPYVSPSLKIVIAGAEPSSKIKKIVTIDTRVVLMPNVEDIKSIYRRAKIFIAPITKGTGMQNKILEAVASGCEVICSKEVSDGLGFKLNTVHVAMNASAYVSEIGNLLSHYGSHLNQREISQNYIASHFNWHDKNKELMDIINQDKI